MFRNLSLAWRMALLLLLGGGCILGAVVGFSYVSSRNLLERELADEARETAQAIACQVESVAKALEQTAKGAAYAIRRFAPGTEGIFGLLEESLINNPEVFGMAVALEHPSWYGVQGVPYVQRQEEEVLFKDLARDGESFRIADWYSLPKFARRSLWTDPYFDDLGGQALMTTYSVPLFSGEGENKIFEGVATADMSLEWFSRILEDLSLDEGGFAFILARNGRFISYPEDAWILRETIFSIAEEYGHPELRELGRRMIAGETGFVFLKDSVMGSEGWVAYVSIPSVEWSLGVFFPREVLVAKIAALTRYQGFLGMLGFAFLLGLILLVTRSITRPLVQLEYATRKLAEGELETSLPHILGEDEVARLAQSFEVMRQQLLVQIDILCATTAAKERIESELHIAQSIQMSLIPKTFPPFPEHEEFDLYALLEPAREVGGDFYDFFMADEQHICLLVGDVSGKGVPAALFMAVTRTFAKILTKNSLDPGEILFKLNNELAQDNESCMFVTIFCAIVHLPSGECRYASGGHNPPFYLPAQGVVTMLPQVKGPLAGALENMVFEEGTFTFSPGDTLFMYTDGVTEAMNNHEELFGEERTALAINKLRGKTPVELIRELRKVLGDFAEGAEQSDDITMMAFTYGVDRKE
jgi:sigma-B regulation protein RsbU (phosphoserine phosphatase)